MTNFDWTDLLHTTQRWDIFKYRLIPYTGYGEFWLDRPITYHTDVRFIEVQSYSTHWIWRILTGQTCYISPRSEIYLGTELFHTLDMTNFDWTDLLHTIQMWDLLRYRLIPYTGYDEFWLDRPVTYHPDLRFIEVQSYSTHWIWRILTGQTCYISSRCEIYWGTEQFHTLDLTNFDWTDLLHIPRSEIYWGTELFHTLDMTNFDWTDLLHTTQIWDLLRYRAIPHTGYDEFWLDRPVTYHPDLRFIEVQSYSTHWIWRILTGQTCYISSRCEIYWGTEQFHTLDLTNFDWTDLLHTTQIWDLLRYRAIPHTGYDEFWLDRPVTYHPDLRFIEVQSYSTHWIWRILTGQTCYIPPRCEIYWGTEQFHTLDMTNFDWTDLLHTTQIWDLLRYRAIPHTGYDEFWLDRPVTYTQIWDLLRYRAIPHTGFDEFWLDRPVTYTQIWDLLRYRAIPHTGYDEFWLDRPVTYHPDLRFIEVQSYSTHWIWRILTGQTCDIPPRSEIYWGTELFHTLDMANFDWTDLLHIIQMWDLLRYRAIPHTGFDEFWLDRPVTYHPDLRFIEVQSYSTHWIWRILTGQTCYIPPRSEIYWGTELFHTLDMTNFDWTDLWHTTQIWDLLRYRAIPHTGYGEFWLDRPVTYHPDVRFIEVQSNSTHWIWRILTGQTCYIPPRSEIYWGTELFHTLDMTNFDWTDLLHTTQIWDLLRYRAIPHTGYGEFWLDRPVTYHPDVRFIEVQSNSTHWIWRILTGQTCYIHTQIWDLLRYRAIPHTGYDEFWLDRPVTYHPDLRFIEVQSYSTHWIWRILTGQTCDIPPRSEIYWGTELFHTLDMANFDWTDLLHIIQMWDLLRYRAIPHTGFDEFWLDRPVTYTQIWDLLRYRAIPHTGYDEFWLDRPVTYHPDLRFIEVQSYSTHWIWRILTGQTCDIPPRSEIYWGTELFHTLDMTNFDWTDLLHITQMWDLLRYRAIPHTGFDEFWLDRPVTYHPDLRFIEVQSYSTHWIWRILTGQTCYIPPRSEIYWGTELFHTLDMANFDWTDLLHTIQMWDLLRYRAIPHTGFDEFWLDRPVTYTQIWDLLRYRAIPHTGYDEFWLDRPVTYHPDLRFIEVQSYSTHWIWRILTGQTCDIPPRSEIYWGTELFHTLDMANFDWTDLLHIIQMWDLLRYRAIPHTGFDEFWLDRPVTYTQIWDLLRYRAIPHTGYDEFWLDRPVTYHPDLRFIEVQSYSTHWIWRILTGQTCYIPPRSEIYWGTELFHTLDMTNFDWTDLWHTTQNFDWTDLRYTHFDGEFWLDRPVTYHPDVRFIEVQSNSTHWIWRILTGQTCYIYPDLRFIEVQSYSTHWIWRILTGQTCYIPPRSEIYWGTELFHTLDMTNFDWTDLLHIIFQMWDLLRYRAIPHTGFDEFWLDRPVTYHPDLRFIEVQSYSTHWIWRILTGQTCYIYPDLRFIEVQSNSTHWIWRILTGQTCYIYPDLRFIEVQSYSTHWIWRILTGQTCYISSRCEIYWGTEQFHTLDLTNFDWTDLLHTTQIWDLLRYRAIPHTGYGEFWLDRPVTYHPDVRFIEVQSNSTHWIWRILTGQTCYIPPRSEIYWGTELFHTLDMTNFDWTDLLHTTQIWDLLRYRAIPHTGYDEFWLDRPVTYHPDVRFIEVQSYSTHWIWRILTGQTCVHTTQIWDLLRYRAIPHTGYGEFWLDRPVTYHPDVRFIEVQSNSTHWIWRILTGQTCYIYPDLRFIEVQSYSTHWIWRILTGQTCYIPPRSEIYWGTELFHTLDMTNFDWTDLWHTTQIWDLLRYRAIPHTGYGEFWLDRPVTYHPDVRFIEVQSNSTHWIWRILTGQTCYIPPRSEIYWGTELFHTLDMTNFDWTDLLHTTQIWDLLRYRAIPHTGYDEFWLDRPVTYHPDVRFIEVQSYSTHWIWRILTGQTCYIPPRSRAIPHTGYDEFWLDRPVTYTQIWDLLRYRAIPHTGFDEFWLDRPVTYPRS